MAQLNLQEQSYGGLHTDITKISENHVPSRASERTGFRPCQLIQTAASLKSVCGNCGVNLLRHGAYGDLRPQSGDLMTG